MNETERGAALGSSNHQSPVTSHQSRSMHGLWPRSLLWRSVLLIAILLVVANVAWLQFFRVSERAPRARQTAQQIASVINITRWALITADSARRFELLSELSQSEGIQVYAVDHDETTEPLPPRPFIQEVASELKRQLGPDTRV